jgi:hypothetical protein
MAMAVIVFLSFLGRGKIVTSHEERVVRSALAMSRAGWPWAATRVVVPLGDSQMKTADAASASPRADSRTLAVNPWLIPVYKGQIRLQKPPLPYWVAAVGFRTLGEKEWVARLGPALMGVLASWLVYLLAIQIASKRTAIVALSIWISCYFVLTEYRKAMADPYLAALSLGATWAWIAACARNASAGVRGLRILLFYGFLALAILAKGPVPLMLLAIALGAYSICYRRRPCALFRWHLLGAILLLVLILPWPLYVISHIPGVIAMWRYESIGEFSDNLRNARPFYYYLPALFYLVLPWTAWWIGGVVLALTKRNRRRLFPLVWMLLTVAVFSFSHMKKYAYLLPIMPAMAILTAEAMVRMIAWARNVKDNAFIGLAARAHAVFGIGLAIAIGIMLLAKHLPIAHLSPHLAATFNKVLIGDRTGGIGAEDVFTTLPFALLATIVALAIAIGPFLVHPTRRFEKWFRLQAFAFAALIFLFVAFPATDRKNHRPSAVFNTQSTDSADLPDDG